MVSKGSEKQEQEKQKTLKGNYKAGGAGRGKESS